MHRHSSIMRAVLIAWSAVPVPLWAKPQTVMVNVRVDSEDPEYKGHLAMDGAKKGMWHTAFRVEPKKLAGPPHPHEIVVDLRRSFEVSGFSLPGHAPNARGAIKEYECYLSDDPQYAGRQYAQDTPPSPGPCPGACPELAKCLTPRPQ